MELKNNEKIVLAAVSKHGCALQYASPELQNNEKIVLKAFFGYGRSLKFASPELRNNENDCFSCSFEIWIGFIICITRTTE